MCDVERNTDYFTERLLAEKEADLIIEINPDFGAIVAANDGYCPCAIEKNEDTRCMCKDFRELTEGECHCGRYKKLKNQTCSGCREWRYDAYTERKYGMGVGICGTDGSPTFCDHPCAYCNPI